MMDGKEALLSRLRLYLFDLDGTLYLGDQVFPFTVPLLKAIRAVGRRYLFMTNNSSRSVEDYVARLTRLGIPAAPEDFITSSQAACWFLRRRYPETRFYVCGTESLREELRREGFALTTEAEEAEGILMGFDTELTFKKLRDVSWLLCTRPGIPYLATNGDLVCPTEFGAVPDCGSVCGMLENVSGRLPQVIGKPSPLMPRLAMERLGTKPEETCVIGDRIYTDIKSGLNAGIASLLVLSGETTPEILEASPDKPDLVLADAGALLEELRRHLA